MKEYELSKILDDYIDLRELFAMYGYPVNRAGFCCCPFHRERTASCRVDKVKYHCFGCDARGNAISLVKGLFSTDFKTAIQKINDDLNLGLLSTELTNEQRTKYNARRLDVYQKTLEEQHKEEEKQTYFEAWRQYIIYKPSRHDYNIDTDEFLINEFWANLDPRWIAAVNTITAMDDLAYVRGYKLDEDDAKNMFTKKVG